MYPAPFRYHRPESLNDAIALLLTLGDAAKPLAGGQSLIPILKLRMDEISDLADITRIPGLDQITQENGQIRIGALATHARIALAPIAKQIPALRDCAGGIADPQVRSRGTIGGSICTADPSGDWAAFLHVLDAQVVSRGRDGERITPIAAFIRDAYTTALASGELVTEIRIESPRGRSGAAYIGFKKAAPAYPAASAGVHLVLGDDDVCRTARLVLGAAGPRPVTSDEAERLLRGKVLKRADFEQAAEAIVARADPPTDARGSSGFKRDMLRSLFLRAADTALQRSRGAQIDGSHAYV